MAFGSCEVRCTFLGKPITTHFRLHEIPGVSPEDLVDADDETLVNLVADHVRKQVVEALEVWPLEDGQYKKKEE